MDKTNSIITITGDELITNERLVFKDNALIMASYGLSIYEQRLVLACIEKSQRKRVPLNSPSIKISLNVNEYADLFKVKMVTAYRALSEASDKLFERSIKMNDEHGTQLEVRWLQEKAKYKDGRVSLKFSETISRYISEIVTERSAYRLEQATQLRSQNAIRMFEMFQMVAKAGDKEGHWEVTIERLKSLLDLEGTYVVWGDFKKRVIEECLKQINKNTSLKVSYVISEKDGRYVKSVRFSVFETEELQLSLGLN